MKWRTGIHENNINELVADIGGPSSVFPQGGATTPSAPLTWRPSPAFLVYSLNVEATATDTYKLGLVNEPLVGFM